MQKHIWKPVAVERPQFRCSQAVHELEVFCSKLRSLVAAADHQDRAAVCTGTSVLQALAIRNRPQFWPIYSKQRLHEAPRQIVAMLTTSDHCGKVVNPCPTIKPIIRLWPASRTGCSRGRRPSEQKRVPAGCSHNKDSRRTALRGLLRATKARARIRETARGAAQAITHHAPHLRRDARRHVRAPRSRGGETGRHADFQPTTRGPLPARLGGSCGRREIRRETALSGTFWYGATASAA